MNIGHHEYHPSSSHASFDAFALEYTKIRDGLPENVRKPLDVLREEVMEICRAHGVDHPSKLVRLEAHASAETLKHVSDLLDDILSIFETKEVPFGHKDWEVEIPEGHVVGDVAGKNGKTFFSTTNHFYSVCCVFDSSGKSIYRHRGSMPNLGLAVIGQDIAYVIQQSNNCLVCRNGKNAGAFQGYNIVNNLLNVGGTLVYTAKEYLTSKEKIFLDGQVYGNPDGYEKVLHILPIGKEPAFAVQKEKGGYFYIYKGEQMVGHPHKYAIEDMTEVNGGIAFTVKDDFGDTFLYHNEVLKGTCVRDHLIHSIQSINGQLSWVEVKGEGEGSTLFIEGEPSMNYSSTIIGVVDTGAEPLLEVQEKEGDLWTLVQGDRVIGKEEGYELTDIHTVICVNDEIIFTTRDHYGEPWIIESSTGTRFGSYKRVLLVKAVDDKHFIVIAEEDGKVVQRTFDLDHPPYQGELET